MKSPVRQLPRAAAPPPREAQPAEDAQQRPTEQHRQTARARQAGADPREALAARISEALDRAAIHDPDAIVRPSVPIEDVSPLDWLRRQHGTARVFWSGRVPGDERAGTGLADCQAGSRPADAGAAFEAVRRRLEASPPGTRYFVAHRFDPDRPASPEWTRFGTFWLALPRFEVARTDGGTELACNLIPERDRGRRDAILEALSAMPLARPLAVPLAMPLARPLEEPLAGEVAAPPRVRIRCRIRCRTDIPGREAWDAAVTSSLGAIAEGRLDKVVLARETRLLLSARLDPADMLEGLRAGSVGSYGFLVEPAPGAPSFVGLSPERLYLREDRRLASESLAGTRPRDGTGDRDRALARELLDSAKEREEHRLVADSIRQVLESLCTDVTGDGQPSILKLATLQHVISRFEGTAAGGIDDRAILQRLHPTPAVGGAPRDRALERIREAEPFDRGWYAGPIGWMGPDRAEFAVAIRSALVDGDAVRIYSGAGIVRGSTPAREWDELERKIAGFLEALG